MARTSLLALVCLAALASASLLPAVLGRRVATGVLQQEYAAASDFAQEVYDSSFLELRGGVSVWQCCRVCPQNHLLEIDQLFGQTPPPVRRYDDAQPSTFLEEAARVAAGDASNCCNICPTGMAGDRPQQAQFTVPKGSAGVRKTGIRAPLANLKFSLSRVPMPPCCPYCREQHLDEAFNLVVPPVRMRGLPYLQRKDKYSGKKVFLELDAELGADADADAEADADSSVDAESAAAGDDSALLESSASARFMREYTYTAPTEDNCCNRCLRSPTAVEASVAAGENVWPVNEQKPPEEEAADEATEAVADGEAEPAAEEAAAEDPPAE